MLQPRLKKTALPVLLQILQKLQADPLAKHPAAAEALSELSVLFKLLGHMQGLQHIDFNMSLARGLDYYTGVIYEAVMLKSWNGGNPQVGSVAAGGRFVTSLPCRTCGARLCAAACIVCAILQCSALLMFIACIWQSSVFASKGSVVSCVMFSSELTILYLGTCVTSFDRRSPFLYCSEQGLGLQITLWYCKCLNCALCYHILHVSNPRFGHHRLVQMCQSGKICLSCCLVA